MGLLSLLRLLAPRPLRRPIARPRRIRIEPLEDRRLLAAILYVNDDATGLNTGASWANAYTDLQAALTAAAPGDEIWVAAGTYKPTAGTDRSISFNLKSGVSVYGGFAATETARDQRNWTTNVTTLSGDIGAAGVDGNSGHVVLAIDVNSATLDGFTVTGGADAGECGGGMFSMRSSAILCNLTFSQNFAFISEASFWEFHTGGGGGLYMSGGSLTLVNVTFDSNRAIGGVRAFTYGGGMYTVGGYVTLSNVTFNQNSASNYQAGGPTLGGGLYVEGSASARLTNVTFTKNSAVGGEGYGNGGGMYDGAWGEITLTDVTFNDNVAILGGGCYGSPSAMTNVTFAGNAAVNGGGMLSDGAPTMNNLLFTANTATGSGGGMLSSGSPVLNNVTFSSNTAAQAGGGLYNAGSSKLTNLIFLDNKASVGGGMANADGSPTLANVTFVGNVANARGGAIDDDPDYPDSATLTNCIVWGNGPTPINETSATVTHSVVEGGWAGEGNLDADPMFVDAANGDLHLKAGSPAIDSGSAVGAPNSDLDGNRRPVDGNGDGIAGFDMGAYEFKASNQAPIAEAAGPYTVVVGHTVALSGAASSDADGTLTLYEWDFNYDGSTFDVDATGAAPTFSAAALQPGDTRTVALRVTDNNGAQSAIDTATVTAMAPRSTPGLYDPAASTFYLRSANLTGNTDYTFAYGQANAGWTTLVGDWNGDDNTGVGLYDPATSTFYLTNAYESGTAQYTFGYGEPGKGWIPLVGDWDGDGRTGVGLYDPHSSTFYLTNTLQTGIAEYTFGYGEPNAGWTPLVGDWNGDGHTGVGLYNPHASTFYLTNSFQTGFAEHTFGYGEPNAGWQPLVGDWNGDHSDGVGLFAPRSSTFYLTNAFTSGYAQYAFGYGEPNAGWKPLVGDWNGNGAAGVGLYAPSSSTFYLTDTLTDGYAEYTVGFGQPGANWQPLVGCWTTAGIQGQTTAPAAQAVDQLDLASLAANELNPARDLDAGLAGS